LTLLLLNIGKALITKQCKITKIHKASLDSTNKESTRSNSKDRRTLDSTCLSKSFKAITTDTSPSKITRIKCQALLARFLGRESTMMKMTATVEVARRSLVDRRTTTMVATLSVSIAIRLTCLTQLSTLTANRSMHVDPMESPVLPHLVVEAEAAQEKL
jgi:hypothetical protein